MAGRCKIREFSEQLSLRVLITQYYRMALIFRGSKFLRIALREHFVEKISRIRGKTPRPQNGCGVLYCTCVKTLVRAELN